ncbi:hypothetical protein BDZ91DRAFT_715641 [Kalaharituber pfeilii]|nr:hypothetical protein BDZ91DRAFT_715641 [Kalaharituber pfeilii]
MYFHNGIGRSLRVALGLLCLVDSTLSAPTSKTTINERAGDACAEIANLAAKGQRMFDADLAYACLTTVPFNSKRSVYIAKQMRLFTQIYSAQTFFYNPPTAALRTKRVDLNGTFDAIEKKASSEDGYPNDYAFQTDLMALYNSFHDGHVQYLPSCAVEFPFFHNYPLVEVWDGDPNHLPAIYTADPVSGELGKEVAEINGEEVHKHLERLALELPDLAWIDPDARYNSLLMAKQPINGLTYGTFAQRSIYNEKDFKLKFKDGEEVNVAWQAYIMRTPIFRNAKEYEEYVCLDPDYEGIENQKKLRNRESTPMKQRRQPSKEEISREIHNYRKRQLEKKNEGTELTARRVNQPNIGWPRLDLAMRDFEQTLHILSEDTAVWGIHAFQGESVTLFNDWQDFMLEALALLKQKNVKNILIDVSGNGGGFVSLGIASIRQFFPTSQPFYGFDLRRSPALDLLVQVSGDADESHLSLESSKDLNNKDFNSIEEFLGPVYKYNDYFTNVGRWDVGDAIMDAGLDVPDEGDPPFSTDNIVLISDGRCGSTCAIFAEAMSNLGVKSIAYNGIPDVPNSKKAMQHVGGVKGSQVWDWETFQTSHVEKYVKNPEQYDFLPKRLPINHFSSMNLRNSYAPGSDLPLEFTWQPANGHLYSTQEMWQDKAELWKACAEMAWDKDGKNILPKAKESRGGNDDSDDNTDQPNNEDEEQTDADQGDDDEVNIITDKRNKWSSYIVLQFNFNWGPDWQVNW